MIPSPVEYGMYAILSNLNLYDAPRLGAKFTGVIPGGARVRITAWKMADEHTIFASIGGYPEQWIRAYHNNGQNINYVGGDDGRQDIRQ